MSAAWALASRWVVCTAGLVVLGEYCRIRPVVSSLLPRCLGVCGSAENASRSVAAVSCAWSVISVPLSQVSDLFRVSGRALTVAVRAALVTGAVYAPGRCTSRVRLASRSARVAIASRFA